MSWLLGFCSTSALCPTEIRAGHEYRHENVSALPVITWEENPMCPPLSALQDRPRCSLSLQRTRTDSAGTSDGLGIREAAQNGKDSDWKL